MNWGKIAIVTLLGGGIAAGAGVWYTQEYAFFDRIDPASPEAEITVETETGPVPLALTAFEGINADSSPIRWRICGRAETLPEGMIPAPNSLPLNGPRWFSCYNAPQIGADLQSGTATAWLAQSEVRTDVDRILVTYPDGRVFGWHEYNEKNPERGVMD
ncbi:DUF6446 family protein [Paracoccus sp. (in: a-proteobacteria)]|uniref:DUF6446 family protein n=1 Tax=Paracoccus sp. TaxID=267 RepID=UPI0027295C78|nr:DUF6446 family protein [Paracoccus sp. (in: a-proteobacteria)]